MMVTLTIPSKILLGACLLAEMVSASVCASAPQSSRWSAFQQKLRFERLKNESGLAIAMVYDVDQDWLGYLWFGTTDGLYRYDGYAFRHVAPDSIVQADRSVRTLFLDQDGNLWYGTNHGAFGKCDPLTLSISRYWDNPADPVRFTGGQVNALFSDRRGELWIGTENNGMFRFDETSGTIDQITRTDGGLLSNRVQAIEKDADGLLWIGTDEGLNSFDRGTGIYRQFKANPKSAQGLAHDNVFSLYRDQFDTLWAGTTDGGLHKVISGKEGDGTPDISFQRVGMPAVYVRGIYRQDPDYIWLATDGDGLCLLHLPTNTSTSFVNDEADPTSISSNLVRSVFVDRTGTMWLGTERWINKLTRRAWHFEFSHYAFPSVPRERRSTTALHVDPEGDLWIGGEFPLFRVSASGTVKRGVYSPHLGNEWTTVVLSDRGTESVRWIGTWGEGVNRVDVGTGRITRYKWSAGRKDDDQVYSMYQDTR
jgi:ligand-binding sensor domain-containing protein